MKPLWILTGATGGIGRELAAKIAMREDIMLVLACRNEARGMELLRSIDSRRGAGTELRVARLDLADFGSVRRFAEEMAATNTPIAALIHNAGTMPGEMHLTADGYESATQTNFLSPLLLTRLLEPQLVKGSVVTFTSSMTRRIVRLRPDWAERAVNHHQRFLTYGRSKLMLTHLALWLSRELAGRGVRVNCSDPGIADTGIIALGIPAVDRAADLLLRPIIHSAAQGAEAMMRAIESRQSGRIFTLRGAKAIPQRWAKSLVGRDIFATLAKDLH